MTLSEFSHLVKNSSSIHPAKSGFLKPLMPNKCNEKYNNSLFIPSDTVSSLSDNVICPEVNVSVVRTIFEIF